MKNERKNSHPEILPQTQRIYRGNLRVAVCHTKVTPPLEFHNFASPELANVVLGFSSSA